MEYFLSLCTTGLVMGVIYALMALGLTLVFSILGVVNFAHGKFYMLGGYASYFFLVTETRVSNVPDAGVLESQASAHITGVYQSALDPRDPFSQGFLL